LNELPPGWPTRTLEPDPSSVLKREESTIVWVEEGGDGGRRVVKLYRRRSRLTEFREEVAGFRTEREWARLDHLERWGIPCTEPLAWAHGRSPSHGWHEVLVTREIPRAVTLDDYLRTVGPAAEIAPLVANVRRMHESGFCHQTLYGRNVLVDPEANPEERYFIADVPRARVFPRGIVGSRPALLDLRDLWVDLALGGFSPDGVPWDSYGLTDRQRRKVTAPLPEGNPRRGLGRQLRDVEVRIRCAGAWAAFWKGRAQPPAGATIP
jgi:tRNA A-37 threonylcarbamoyl transferase component Bud32